ncbi:MAG TPA: diacylglycerol kinase family protein [Thermoanaerobaculia bacterium]|nr:diacylglycerol kinase family protein [Thermoanaerobaculia bacterium]
MSVQRNDSRKGGPGAGSKPSRKGLLVYNPTAGQKDRREQMRELAATLEERGLEVIHAPTGGPGHATQIVRSHLSEGLDVVAVCGGDGTISEAACGLAGSDTPLAILPGGTSNVLVRELAIPLDLGKAADLLFEGVPRRLRMLVANERPFLLWAGVGLDARIMGNMMPTLKRWFGRSGIFVTVAREFFRYEFPRLEVTVDGVVHEATFAVVCHATRYAGDWIIAPEASLESDEMDVVLFSGRGRWKFFKLFREIQLGKSGHLLNGIARIVRGKQISIRSLEDYPVEVQVDGDCVLKTPITCHVAGESVSILVPGETISS